MPQKNQDLFGTQVLPRVLATENKSKGERRETVLQVVVVVAVPPRIASVYGRKGTLAIFGAICAGAGFAVIKFTVIFVNRWVRNQDRTGNAVYKPVRREFVRIVSTQV